MTGARSRPGLEADGRRARGRDGRRERIRAELQLTDGDLRAPLDGAGLTLPLD